MEPASFPESNLTLSPPEGVPERGPGDTEGVGSLRVLRTVIEGTEQPVVISCWRVSAAELEEIQRTGRVWLCVLGITMPPAWLEGRRPFEVVP